MGNVGEEAGMLVGSATADSTTWSEHTHTHKHQHTQMHTHTHTMLVWALSQLLVKSEWVQTILVMELS